MPLAVLVGELWTFVGLPPGLLVGGGTNATNELAPEKYSRQI